MAVANQYAADDYCRSIGMKLFVLDSEETQTSLFNELFDLLDKYSMTFRVDGVQDDEDGLWYYDDGKTPASSDLSWRVSSDPFLDWNTLVVTNTAFPLKVYLPTYTIDMVPAGKTCPFICEFLE